MRHSLIKETISPAGKAQPFRTVRRQSRRRLSVVCFADGVSYEGKSCFNFKTVDEKLLEELEKFTKAGFKKFHNPEFLQKLTQG